MEPIIEVLNSPVTRAIGCILVISGIATGIAAQSVTQLIVGVATGIAIIFAQDVAFSIAYGPEHQLATSEISSTLNSDFAKIEAPPRDIKRVVSVNANLSAEDCALLAVTAPAEWPRFQSSVYRVHQNNSPVVETSDQYGETVLITAKNFLISSGCH